MPNKPWKAAERRAATLFGTKRRRLSGNTSGRERTDELGCDTEHERLYIEVKQGKQCNRFYTLYADTARKAAREKHPNGSRRNRVPVVILQAKHQKGMLLVVHSSDLGALLTEYAAANCFVSPNDQLVSLDDIRAGDLVVNDRSADLPKPNKLQPTNSNGQDSKTTTPGIERPIRGVKSRTQVSRQSTHPAGRPKPKRKMG